MAQRRAAKSRGDDGGRGERLTLLRTAFGFTTQRDFARATGLSETTISNLVSGKKRQMRNSTYAKIGEALGIAPDLVADYIEQAVPINLHTAITGTGVTKSIADHGDWHALSPRDLGYALAHWISLGAEDRERLRMSMAETEGGYWIRPQIKSA